MSKLDDDVATLTATVATLADLVATAIVALSKIVDTSTDEAAIEAANTALQTLSANIQTAITPTTPAA